MLYIGPQLTLQQHAVIPATAILIVFLTLFIYDISYIKRTVGVSPYTLMPHISRHNLAQKTYDEIMRALLVALSRCNDTSVQRHFTDSFLTKTERTMLAKRLAIIAMVRQGIAPHHIAQVLKVSPSTVARFTLLAEDRAFAFISPIRKKEKSVQDILDLVEKILQAGLPPKVGKGRWKRYFEA